MKTLIFSILLLICGLKSVARAADPYDNLAWIPFRANVAPEAVYLPHDTSLLTFRRFFHRWPNPKFHVLLQECGVPSDKWSDSGPANSMEHFPPHLPRYYGGHLFRYPFPDGAHVYIWTGEDDESVMRADYFSNSGRVEPLYLRPL